MESTASKLGKLSSWRSASRLFWMSLLFVGIAIPTYSNTIKYTSEKVYVQTLQELLTGGQATAPEIISTWDRRELPVSDATSVLVNSTAFIGLYYDHFKPLFQEAIAGGNATLELTCDFIYYTKSNPAVAQTLTGQILKVEVFKDANGQYTFKESERIKIENAFKVSVSITGISSTGLVVGSSLLDNTYMEAEISTERYGIFDATHQLITGLSNTYDQNLRQLLLSWSSASTPWADQYELEYTYVDNYSEVLSTKLTSAEMPKVNFRNDATRIVTFNNNVYVPIIYDQGYLVFRVRAIGVQVNSNGTLSRIEGPWTTHDPANNRGDQFNFSSLVTGEYFEITESSSMNYTSASSFAEEGKRKDVVQYFDGTLRGRQTITSTNTEKQWVVGETLYDFEGRPAVEVLPSPIDIVKSTTVKPSFPYLEDLNMDYNDRKYSKLDFDLQDKTDKCNITTPPMNPGTSTTGSIGSSNYYSSNIKVADTEGNNALIPDGKGYTFIQKEFTPDNTGRVQRASGPGDAHYLGSGHESKMIYANTAQFELDRLFGTDVGDAIHYDKTYSIDANGQMSVAYQDLRGKTIATALYGENPKDKVTGNDILSPLQSLTDYPTGLLSTDKKLGCTDCGDRNINTGNKLVYSTKIVVPAVTDYTISYQLEPEDFKPSATIDIPPGFDNANCGYANLCMECKYDLEINLYNDCGEDLSSLLGTMAGSHSIGTLSSNLQCDASTPAYPLSVTIEDLPMGSYYLTKTLTLNKTAIDTYVNNFFDQTTNTCVKTSESYVETQLTAHNQDVLNVCEKDVCSACLEKFGMEKSNVNASMDLADDATLKQLYLLYQANVADIPEPEFSNEEDFKTALLECFSYCFKTTSDVNQCEMSYMMMLTDVSEGGQYLSTNEDTDQEISTEINEGKEASDKSDNSKWSFSLLNNDNILPNQLDNNKKSCYRYPKESYQNKNGDFAYVPINFVNIPDDIKGFSSILRYIEAAMTSSNTVTLGNFTSPKVYKPNNGYSLSELIFLATIDENGSYNPNNNASSNLDNDQEFEYVVKPEMLEDWKDFVSFWDPAWAKTLVLMHPEYKYYKECSQIKYNATINNVTDNYDAYLADIKSYQEATQIFTSSLDLFDPYDPYKGNLACSTAIANKLNNYQKIGGEDLTLKEFVAATITCGNKYYESLTSQNCMGSFGTGAVDEQWELYRNLYLSIRREQLDKVIKGKAPQISNMFKGSPYKDKVVPRFIFTDDLQDKACLCGDAGDPDRIERMTKEAEVKFLQETGKCPGDQDLETLISRVFAETQNTIFPYGKSYYPKTLCDKLNANSGSNTALSNNKIDKSIGNSAGNNILSFVVSGLAGTPNKHDISIVVPSFTLEHEMNSEVLVGTEKNIVPVIWKISKAGPIALSSFASDKTFNLPAITSSVEIIAEDGETTNTTVSKDFTIQALGFQNLTYVNYAGDRYEFTLQMRFALYEGNGVDAAKKLKEFTVDANGSTSIELGSCEELYGLCVLSEPGLGVQDLLNGLAVSQGFGTGSTTAVDNDLLPQALSSYLQGCAATLPNSQISVISSLITTTGATKGNVTLDFLQGTTNTFSVSLTPKNAVTNTNFDKFSDIKSFSCLSLFPDNANTPEDESLKMFKITATVDVSAAEDGSNLVTIEYKGEVTSAVTCNFSMTDCGYDHTIYCNDVENKNTRDLATLLNSLVNPVGLVLSEFKTSSTYKPFADGNTYTLSQNPVFMGPILRQLQEGNHPMANYEAKSSVITQGTQQVMRLSFVRQEGGINLEIGYLKLVLSDATAAKSFSTIKSYQGLVAVENGQSDPTTFNIKGLYMVSDGATTPTYTLASTTLSGESVLRVANCKSSFGKQLIFANTFEEFNQDPSNQVTIGCGKDLYINSSNMEIIDMDQQHYYITKNADKYSTDCGTFQVIIDNGSGGPSGGRLSNTLYPTLIGKDHTTSKTNFLLMKPTCQSSIDCKEGAFNTVLNGDFTLGNFGFFSEYTYSQPNSGQVFQEGAYGVFTNPKAFHSSFTGVDHTSGRGNFMIVNGATTLNKIVWKQAVLVKPFTTYKFSVWVASMLDNPAKLHFKVNGTDVGSLIAGSQAGVWQEFTATWSSQAYGYKTAYISIVDDNLSANGNDFGLDDISFTEQCVNQTIPNNPYPIWNKEFDLPKQKGACEVQFFIANPLPLEVVGHTQDYVDYHNSLSNGVLILEYSQDDGVSWRKLPFTVNRAFKAPQNQTTIVPMYDNRWYKVRTSFICEGLENEKVSFRVSMASKIYYTNDGWISSAPQPVPCAIALDDIIVTFKPRPEDPLPVPAEEIEEDDCAQYALDLFTDRFEKEYNEMRENLEADIRAAYMAKCLKAKETLNFIYPDKEYHYTLYYYDQAGNLIQTVPPAGVDMAFRFKTSTQLDQVATDRASQVKNVPAHQKVTKYQYNSLNEIAQSETPDGGVSKFWYDDLGRIVLSQNAKQATLDPSNTTPIWERYARFSYSMYDAQGRVIEVGEMLDFNNVIKTNPAAHISTFSRNYVRDVVRTYYDESILSAANNNVIPGFTQQNLRKRVASVFYFADPGTLPSYELNNTVCDHASHYSYDIHGNVDVMVQEYPALQDFGNEARYKFLKYDYDQVSGKVNQLDYQNGKIDQFYYQYHYDADNRVVRALSSQDGNKWTRDAEYFYYKHGPLYRLELGENKVQGQDHAYTIQGWLKAMNSPTLTYTNDMGKDGVSSNKHRYMPQDEFGYMLGYYDKDYQSIGAANFLPANANNLGFKGLYNSNISHMVYAVDDYLAKQRTERTDHLATPKVTRYDYDQLNRIKKEELLTDYGVTNSNVWASATPSTEYGSTYSYDADGNLLTLKRDAYNLSGSADMDQLSYSYQTGKNRLDHVSDAAVDKGLNDLKQGQLASNYQYDAIGNLVKDKQEEIDKIEWNVQGKIKSIQRELGSVKPDLDFTYDNQGNRICKVVKPRTIAGLMASSAWEYTYYMRDASGNVLAVYTLKAGQGADAGKEVLAQEEAHLYGSSRLGMYKPYTKVQPRWVLNRDASTGAVTGVVQSPSLLSQKYAQYSGTRFYELKDHLGNVAVVVNDTKVPVKASATGTEEGYQAQLMSYTHYYPFGMEMPGMGYTSEAYRYGYNGQEKEQELGEGVASAEFWIYDGKLGRRWEMDPVSFEHISPYATFENNPILLNDPDGDCPTCKGGDEVYTKGHIEETKEGRWEYLGNNKWKTLVLNLGNSTQDFKEYYNQAGGPEAIDKIGDKILEQKLSDRYYGIGRFSEDDYTVPQAVYSELRNASNAEAFDAFKTLYAMEKSGEDPSSFKFFINPLARANYMNARAQAVTSSQEALGVVAGVALDVALSYVGRPIVIKNTQPFRGYGLFGQKGLTIYGYKIEAMYRDGAKPLGRTGTYLSIKQMKNEGALFRLDYGAHSGSKAYLHPHARFYLFGNKFGSSKPLW